MKRMLATIFLTAYLFSGCSDMDSGLNYALSLREKLQNNSCTFQIEINADYGDYIHSFAMECSADSQGDLSFTVVSPETIQGITGRISDTGGNLVFDENVLAFNVLADGQISPVSVPWLLIRTLRSGYIRASTETQNGMKLIIDDSYEEESLQMDIWLDENTLPCEAEILWKGRRIMSLKIKNFLWQ